MKSDNFYYIVYRDGSFSFDAKQVNIIPSNNALFYLKESHKTNKELSLNGEISESVFLFVDDNMKVQRYAIDNISLLKFYCNKHFFWYSERKRCYESFLYVITIEVETPNNIVKYEFKVDKKSTKQKIFKVVCDFIDKINNIGYSNYVEYEKLLQEIESKQQEINSLKRKINNLRK